VSEAAVVLERVRVWSADASGARRIAVQQLSLRIEVGARVAVVGPNGAGKTSLLLALVGATPFEGNIQIGGVDLARGTLERVRRQIGFVFAEPSDQLFSPTVEDEVAFGPRQRGRTETETAEATEQALATVGLTDFGSRSPRRLSLGEQRRLAVATALACRPRLLLIDEPTASLDPVARQAILRTLAGLDATVIMATHDLDAALALNAEVVLLQDGRLVRTGPAAQILTDAELLHHAGLLLPISVAARRPHQ
jgi:cobalt/nickel transport system ATP-binding protein